MKTAPKVCLTLTAPTIAEDVAIARKYAAYCDLVELRVDRLAPAERADIIAFPNSIERPAILTARRVRDGGAFTEDGERARISLLQDNLPAFDYVDLESDLVAPDLEALAARSSTRIIRSVHRFDGLDADEAASIDALCHSATEIPKLAFKANTLADVTAFLRIAAALPPRERIFCAMGAAGAVTRILPGAFGSFLTFASPPEAMASMGGIGHIDIVRLNEIFHVRSIGPDTRPCGVTGWPLAVTASPEIHRRLCDRDGVDSVMIPLPTEDVREAVELCEALDFAGLAVTVPHKEALLPLLDEVSPEAAGIGAANTVFWLGGKRFGFNTDIGGFTDAISAFADRCDFSSVRVAMIGSGGAARAVAYALGKLGAKGAVFARNVAKAQEVAALAGFEAQPLEALANAEGLDLIVQCTSVGNGSSDPADDPAPAYRFTGRELVYDLIYKPEKTPFLTRASRAGCRVENGMSMLKAQGEIQHKLFHGLE